MEVRSERRPRKGRRQKKKKSERETQAEGWGAVRAEVSGHSMYLLAETKWPAGGCGCVPNTERARPGCIFRGKSSRTCLATGASAGRGSLFCTSPTRTVRGPRSCSSAASKAYPCSSKSPSAADSKALLGRSSFLNGQREEGR